MRIYLASTLAKALSIMLVLINSAIASSASDGDRQPLLFLEANSAKNQQLPKKAIALYEQLIAEKMRQDPHSPFILRSRIRIACILLDTGQMDKAEHTFKEVVKLAASRLKEDRELLVEMDEFADSYRNLALKQNTKECLIHALQLRKRIDPHHPRVYISYRDLAIYAHNHGDDRSAISYIKSAIEIEKNFSRFKTDQLINDQLVLTSLYGTTNEFDKSEKQAKQILQLSKNAPDLRWSWSRCHYELGRCFAKKYDYDKSNLEYNTALELIRKYPSRRGDVSLLCLQGLQENATLKVRNKAKIKKASTHSCRNAAISAGVGKSITAPSRKG